MLQGLTVFRVTRDSGKEREREKGIPQRMSSKVSEIVVNDDNNNDLLTIRKTANQLAKNWIGRLNVNKQSNFQ